MLKRLFPLSLILYRGSDELNHDFVLVGYGRTGTGRTGASDYDGLKRGCQNRIEEYIVANNQSMAFLFNAPPAGFPLEGKGAPGDIGSAAFALIDGKYWLAVFRAVAVTIDDLPAVRSGGDLETIREKTDKLLSHLTDSETPATGFVNEIKLNVPGEVQARTALLKAWLEAGFDLGNHTYSHASTPGRTPKPEPPLNPS